MSEYIERTPWVDAEKIVSVTWDTFCGKHLHVMADGRKAWTPLQEQASVGDYWIFSPGVPRHRDREKFESEYHKA